MGANIGAEFQVSQTQNGKTMYLYSNGSGWAWSGDKANAQTFQSVTSAPNGDTADNWHSLFEISGLGDGTYTVTETKVPAGYDQNVLPSFQVTVTAGQPEKVTSTTASYGLVNNTPGGNVIRLHTVLYQFLTAASGGFNEAFSDVTYTSSDGEALNWLLTSSHLGSDATGQNLSMPSDNAVRLLANWLYSHDHNINWTQEVATHGQVTTNDGYQEETYTLPNPGIYLVVDSTNNGNTAMPMIVSTVATGDAGYTGPLTQYMTSQIGLKTQDPQAAPVKQFVKDATTSTDTNAAGITGTLTNSMTASVGMANNKV